MKFKTPDSQPKAQLILALDVNTFKEAKTFIDRLYPAIKIFKVGSQLFTGTGPKTIDYIHKKGGEVFLDLKFYDIPNTVANAVRQAASLKVKMLTLHISGQEAMLKAAVQASKECNTGRPLLIGVTVLTSLEAKPEDVVRLARQAIECGLDGVVASVQETAMLRQYIHRDFIIVTPGIRLAGATLGDQKRVATPEEAVEAGSNFLVAGRPILEARSPLKAAKEITAACEKFREKELWQKILRRS